MKFLGYVLTLSLIASVSSASPFSTLSDATPVCFSATYSDAHMKSHPVQTVKAMSLKFKKDSATYGDMVILNVNAKIKTKKGIKPYHNSMGCGLNDTGTEMTCSIDCDGGSAVVQWDLQNDAKDNIKFINKGFVMYGGCGDDIADGEDMIWLEPKQGGDDVFNMKKLDAKSCAKVK